MPAAPKASTRKNKASQANADAAPSLPVLSKADVAAFRRKLIAWYRQAKRDLPWRQSPQDPYATMVSEAMLQQTQVVTAVPYFNRFMARFPTVFDLAKADEAEVLKHWEGLGYYRRARHLHAAAKAVVEQHGGHVPKDLDVLLALPGVGPYSAGAIRSIGHNLPAPLVDGNVERVFARWFAIEADFGQTKARKPLWALAEQLVSPTAPSDFNQGLMELGATVCTPANPGCLTCPMAKLCVANEQGLQDKLPVKKKRVKPKPITHHVFVVQQSGRFAANQRPDDGLWAGMWGFVTLEANDPATIKNTADADQRQSWLAERLGVKRDRLAPVDAPKHAFKHQTTHRTITVESHLFDLAGTSSKARKTAAPTLGVAWLGLADLDGVALPKPQLKVLAWLKDLVKQGLVDAE